MPHVIVALDVPERVSALAMVDRLGVACEFYKVGLELYTREGPDIVRALRERGKRVFLDLKLHDIPNTVGRSVRAAIDLEVDLLTVHATGGEAMLRAAVEAAAGSPTRVLAVTVLTSLGPDDLARVWGRPVGSLPDEVGRLAELGRRAGVHGFVSSVHEAGLLRERLGRDPWLVTPGIRLEGGDAHDQTRVATPAAAARAGADALVVGRAITAADDPVQALRRVLEACS